VGRVSRVSRNANSGPSNIQCLTMPCATTQGIFFAHAQLRVVLQATRPIVAYEAALDQDSVSVP
jgi:hypothetical protein